MPADRLTDFEQRHRIQLPVDLKELLLYSNGLGLFGTPIQSLEEMELYEDQLLLTFHNWGNGDFDCVSVDRNARYGEVFFADHSPDKSTPIGLTFCDWISAVIRETEESGTIPHPMDYSLYDKNGIYKSVYLKNKKED